MVSATARPFAWPSDTRLLAMLDRCECASSSGCCGRDSAARILSREPYIRTSSNPAEVVTCDLRDGMVRSILFKYGGYDAGDHLAHGHRYGVAFEGRVYRELLRDLPVETVPCYGSAAEGDGLEWIALGYRADAVRVYESTDREAMPRAAAWLARFHASGAQWLHSNTVSMLPVYDAAFYFGWADRTVEFACRREEPLDWLPSVCAGWPDVARALVQAQQAPIHGEYYPKNLLYADHAVYPIDWESAAVGPGEIDLAMLVDGWPARIADECLEVYRRERWPGGAPESHAKVLAAARIYLLCRWLGDRPSWTLGRRAIHLLDRLHELHCSYQQKYGDSRSGGTQ